MSFLINTFDTRWDDNFQFLKIIFQFTCPSKASLIAKHSQFSKKSPQKKNILNWRFTKNIPKNISSAKKRETTNLHWERKTISGNELNSLRKFKQFLILFSRWLLCHVYLCDSCYYSFFFSFWKKINYLILLCCL